MTDKPTRIAQLKAEIAERQAELLRLARGYAADVAGLRGDEREFFMGLQPITKPAKVSSDNMTDSHRIALSESRSGKGQDAFLTCIRAAKPKGFTLRSLADALDISQPTLSAHRLPRSNPNHRPIPPARAKLVKKLTGWPDDAAHWPCGFAG